MFCSSNNNAYLCKENIRLNNIIRKDMALPIASIPVLTGEVAQRFEAEAQANYEKFLNRTPEEEEAVRERYDRGMAIVKKVLENSRLGRR